MTRALEAEWDELQLFTNSRLLANAPSCAHVFLVKAHNHEQLGPDTLAHSQKAQHLVILHPPPLAHMAGISGGAGRP